MTLEGSPSDPPILPKDAYPQREIFILAALTARIPVSLCSQAFASYGLENERWARRGESFPRIGMTTRQSP